MEETTAGEVAYIMYIYYPWYSLYYSLSLVRRLSPQALFRPLTLTARGEPADEAN